MNIVLDTNIIRKDLNFTSGNYRILNDYLSKTGSDFIIPRIVIDEALGIYRRNLIDKHSTVNNAILKLNKALIVNAEIPNVEINIEAELVEYTNILKEKLKLRNQTIIEYENSLLPEIVERCISRVKPAKEDGKQFRDVLLWLSIVHYLKVSGNTEIIFISENYKDFGTSKPNIIHPTLEKEIEDLGKTISYFNGYESFIKEVATPIEFITKEWLKDNFDYELVHRHLSEILVGENETLLRNIENDLNYDNELDVPSIESTEYYNLLELDFSVYKLTEGDIFIKTSLEIELEFGYSYTKPVETVNFQYSRSYGYDEGGNPFKSREVVPITEIDYEVEYGNLTPVIICEVLLTVQEEKIVDYEFESWYDQ